MGEVKLKTLHSLEVNSVRGLLKEINSLGLQKDDILSIIPDEKEHCFRVLYYK